MKKKLITLFTAALILIMSILSMGCSKANAIEKIRDLIDEEGILDGFCVLHENATDLTATYIFDDEDSVTLSIDEADLYFQITITKDSDVIKWRGSSDDYAMRGSFDADTITKDTTSLPYDTTTTPYYLTLLFNKNCALSLQLLLYSANDNFESIDVTVSDLGFTDWE